MLEAAKLEFDRVAHEFAEWQAVPGAERSPAPPWWWGVAIEIMNEGDAMTPSLCRLMDIPAGASYAQAASKLMNALSGQTTLPPHDEFPRKRLGPELKPMKTFDPTQPAILHDRTSDRIETWPADDAADFLKTSVARPDGAVEWRQFVFDGWDNVLGG